MSDGDKLSEHVSRVIEVRQEAVRLSPSWIATEVMAQLDPGASVQRDFPLIYISSHLQLRQIARSKLRDRFVVEETDQHPLFPDLQRRYPSARTIASEEPEYILEERMTDADYAANIQRLESESRSKQRHADALKSRRLQRFGQVPGAA